MVAEVAKFKSNLKTLFCGYSRTIFLTFGSYLSVYTVACESSRIFFSVAEATLRRIWQAVSCCPVLLPHLLEPAPHGGREYPEGRGASTLKTELYR